MTKHTSGPWKVHEPYSGDADRAIYALSPINRNPVFVARAYGGGALAPRDPEHDANARLIAAAPDMLAALKYVIDCDRRDDLSDLQPVLDAIAKAERKV